MFFQRELMNNHISETHHLKPKIKGQGTLNQGLGSQNQGQVPQKKEGTC
jgi:hypothetical protein